MLSNIVKLISAGREQAGGGLPRHDVPHLPHGQHVSRGGGGGGGGTVLASSREDQGDHDQLPQGDRGEHPEVPQDREGDIPGVQGRGPVPAGRDLERGLYPGAR